ncbi:MAG: hypothetical protein COB15_05990 [Flavobacteriales bacterium]|nr:MAG: hypothetical protein COB15_05990 [Flavobacteriales bacterium]
MNITHFTKRKFCVLCKNETTLLTDFFLFSKNDSIKDISFDKFSITELETYAPDAIIIDNYYTEGNNRMIIDSITTKFKNTQVFVISPEYAEYNCVIKSFDCENHFFSNLNENIIQLVNSTIGCDPSSYLTAS